MYSVFNIYHPLLEDNHNFGSSQLSSIFPSFPAPLKDCKAEFSNLMSPLVRHAVTQRRALFNTKILVYVFSSSSSFTFR